MVNFVFFRATLREVRVASVGLVETGPATGEGDLAPAADRPRIHATERGRRRGHDGDEHTHLSVAESGGFLDCARAIVLAAIGPAPLVT